MASAYIRSKGAGYDNVYQLYGGIQRYLEQFPDGGFFKGKNFVFDHRVSVGSQDANIIGACLLCGTEFDDYSSRSRCTYCRMLVLVCYSCQGKGTAGYVCELCKKNGKGESRPMPCIKDDELDVISVTPSNQIALSSGISGKHGNLQKKLRILCLHGFRQNASNFKGRTASLAKKLKNIAELVFVNAPHELPFIYQTTDLTAQLRPPPSIETCKKRFAWLISSKNLSDESCLIAADEPFDPLQYQQQTDGFEESYSYLQNVISQLGPFDGILGFSQGSTMAALFLEHQQEICRRSDFRFAILCSGFLVITEKLGTEMIKCPSLHVFGDGRGRDRQIDCEASRKLAELFDMHCSDIIEHEMGHIIPTRSPYIDRLKEFLQRFI